MTIYGFIFRRIISIHVSPDSSISLMLINLFLINLNHLYNKCNDFQVFLVFVDMILLL